MRGFSKRSKRELATCDDRLVSILNTALELIDFTVLEGHRPEARQNELYEQGKSKVKYPDSKHNSVVSLAADVAPYPIDWDDTERFTYLAGIIIGIAKIMGIGIRWGGDWDRDGLMSDERFRDMGHFEVVD